MNPNNYAKRLNGINKFFKRKIPQFKKKNFFLLKNWFFWFKLFYIDNVGGYSLGEIYNKHSILQNMLQVQKDLQL